MIIGVVGKANVGKSTFFKAATLAEVEIGNYPFVTIKPNSGVGYVRVECVDKEFNTTCMPKHGYCLDGTRFVPVQLIDVAGLVPGAHEGKGMGNQFLDDLRQADAFIHVIDCAGTTNEKGEVVEPGSYDPTNDVRFLEVELDMWILGLLKKGWERFAREVKQSKDVVIKAVSKHLTGLGVNEKLAENVIKSLNMPEDILTWDEKILLQLATALRKRTKPMIVACNKIDMPGAEANYQRLKNEFPETMFVPCSAESELALKEAAKRGLINYKPGSKDFTVMQQDNLTGKQIMALDFVQQNILQKYGGTGVQEVLDKAVFELLGYIAIFPGGVNKLHDQFGNILPDCFLIPGGSTALDFAFKIHTDLGSSFIRAIDVKTKKTVGKEHLLKHRDVVEIISGK